MSFADFQIALSSANRDNSMPSASNSLFKDFFNVCILALNRVRLITPSLGDSFSGSCCSEVKVSIYTLIFLSSKKKFCIHFSIVPFITKVAKLK